MENISPFSKEEILFDLGKIPNKFKIKEICLSFSGNKFGAILFDMENGGYFFMENGNILNSDPWDKAWQLIYSPEEEPYVLVSKEGMWYLFKQKEEIGEYDYLWDLMFNDKNSYAVAIKKDDQYGMLVDDREWEKLYVYAMDFSIAKLTSDTSASAQTIMTDEKDVLAFKEGTFSLIKNGEVINGPFVTIRYPTISQEGKSVAAIGRDTEHNFRVIVDDNIWEEAFSLAWNPMFHPKNNSLFVPVKKGRKWFLYRNGDKFWDESFMQLWNLQFSDNGESLAAICSKKFGRFTVCVNGECWSKNFPVIEKIVINQDGSMVLAIVNKEYPSLNIYETIPKSKKQIFLNNKEASDIFDRITHPTFSPNGEDFVAIGEKDGIYYIILNGDTLDVSFSKIWEPVFLDENHILIKGIIDNKVSRLTINIP